MYVYVCVYINISQNSHVLQKSYIKNNEAYEKMVWGVECKTLSPRSIIKTLTKMIAGTLRYEQFRQLAVLVD